MSPDQTRMPAHRRKERASFRRVTRAAWSRLRSCCLQPWPEAHAACLTGPHALELVELAKIVFDVEHRQPVATADAALHQGSERCLQVTGKLDVDAQVRVMF